MHVACQIEISYLSVSMFFCGVSAIVLLFVRYHVKEELNSRFSHKKQTISFVGSEKLSNFVIERSKKSLS